MTAYTNKKTGSTTFEAPAIFTESFIPEKRSCAVYQENLMSMASSSENIKDPLQKKSLMEFLQEFKVLPAPVIRTLFKNIVEEVSKLHLNESYHGDLNLENISFDQEYNVSLSPKVHICDSFLDGAYVDLIYLGEILFALCFGSVPYISLEDERYLAILNGDWELFWAINEEILKVEKRGLNLSKSGLKDLISSFLSGQANSKYDLHQLLAHEWMKGTTLTPGQVRSLFNEVSKKMQKMM